MSPMTSSEKQEQGMLHQKCATIPLVLYKCSLKPDLSPRVSLDTFSKNSIHLALLQITETLLSHWKSWSQAKDSKQEFYVPYR